MPSSASLIDARQFAASVAGVVERATGSEPPASWAPGATGRAADPSLSSALDAIGWESVAEDPSLVQCAGLGAVELGRRRCSLWEIDRLLGGSPMAGDLLRCLGPATGSGVARAAVVRDGAVFGVVRCERCPSADGLDVHRVLELAPWGETVSSAARGAWLAASVGYLAGLGESALALTVAYTRERAAFGSVLAALGPVQQLLAAAATQVRGVRLLAEGPCDEAALAHAGPAIAAACAACQQVSGAIGYTLEYPLHGHTQRARALTAWGEALLDAGV